ncbi:hypothetical protein [Pseudoalteromonas sp. PS5]|uniref:hypothetical protein n=1 Tax=Pseudoalteromonas sp. PS5 TaxID=1437473 RepID=UPI001F502D5F|nr:hypothetical protein [Pseudoalteromonas sp. PS5]
MTHFIEVLFFSINETKDNHFVVAGLRGNAFIGSGQQVQQLKTDKTATINNIIVDDSTTYMLANSGVIFSIKNGEVTSKQLKNGHSILSGVLKNKSLVLATEQGIAEIEVGN